MYRIGQVADIMGISKDKLRYYEEKGILQPKQNNENNYRQYDVNNIDTILAVEFYRSLDLEFKSIEKIHSGCGLKGIEDILNKKHSDVKSEIERLNNIARRIEKTQKACSDIEKYLNKFVIKAMPKVKVTGEISDFRAYSEFEAIHKNGSTDSPIVKKLKRYITFNETGIETNKMLITNDLEDDGGYSEKDDNILSYEKCAYTIVEDSFRCDAMQNTYEKSRKWLYENGLISLGIVIIGMILLEYSEGEIKSYLEVYIPLQ